MRRYLSLILLFFVLALVLAGCGSSKEKTREAEIASSVQATLTAIAPTQNPDDSTPVASSPALSTPAASTADNPGPAAAANITLPPVVPNFNPAPRPASSKGDPEAPVVIYEWSDYT